MQKNSLQADRNRSFLQIAEKSSRGAIQSPCGARFNGNDHVSVRRATTRTLRADTPRAKRLGGLNGHSGGSPLWGVLDLQGRIEGKWIRF